MWGREIGKVDSEETPRPNVVTPAQAGVQEKTNNQDYCFRRYYGLV
jgi:hypothetical protein